MKQRSVDLGIEGGGLDRGMTEEGPNGRDFLRVVNFSSFLSNGLPSAVFP